MRQSLSATCGFSPGTPVCSMGFNTYTPNLESIMQKSAIIFFIFKKLKLVSMFLMQERRKHQIFHSLFVFVCLFVCLRVCLFLFFVSIYR